MILTDTDLKFEAENSPEANVTLQLCKSKMDHEASGTCKMMHASGFRGREIMRGG